MSERLWYERYPRRLVAEKIIMVENHPQFVLKMDDQKRLFWDGILQTNFGTFYRANIIYPAAYPWEKPKLYIVEPSLQLDSPHLHSDGTLCVYPDDWDHKRCTAPAAVPLIVAWATLYEIFLRTGERW
jgi:ubiquitin-protein ligase